MRQFDFTTNIEKRMPKTGEVACIDRMTSDYAERHPLDVDGFIEGVYQEFRGTAFEEPREELHRIWKAALSVTNPCGDPSIYPNKNGARRAAAMKVWLKAGDYWRRGLRLGDILPDMVPMTKITRLDDGSWIALFPKDERLLRRETPYNPSVGDGEGQPLQSAECFQREEAPIEEPAFHIEEATTEEAPSLQSAERFQREEAPRPIGPTACPSLHPCEPPACDHRPQPPRRPAHACRRTPQPPAAPSIEEPDADREWLRTAGYLAAASVALLVIWKTGLIIPLGLIGLATGGILK